MVTIKIPGTSDIKLTEREFNELATALRVMVAWGDGGMYGEGSGEITNKAGFKRAVKTLEKIKY